MILGCNVISFFIFASLIIKYTATIKKATKQHHYFIMDLLIINFVAYFLPINLQENFLFHAYISLCWITISLMTEFYVIYRYTKVTHILKLLFKQFSFIFLLSMHSLDFSNNPT